MQRVKLDSQPPAVKEFISTLPFCEEDVELELNGHVVCKVLGPNALSDAEKAALITRGRELVRRARERNQGVPADVIEREVRQAVGEVRGRKK